MPRLLRQTLAWVVALAACGGSTAAVDAVGVVTGEVCGDPLETAAVVVDRGLAVTAAHGVVGAMEPLTLQFADGVSVAADVVAVDVVRDIAALRFAGAGPSPASLGDRVSPAGSIVRLDDDLQLRTVDHVDGRALTITGDDIYEQPSDVERAGVRVAANIEPGFSGGPVINEDGEVVGIVIAESRGSGSVFALASSEIQAFLARVAAGELLGVADCR